jgi:predicted lipoprotein with Yx(FWY)xxD motif
VSKKSLGKIAHDQVKYHGHPLYYYTGDTAAKQANGEGLFAFKGYWYTLTAKGKRG